MKVTSKAAAGLLGLLCSQAVEVHAHMSAAHLLVNGSDLGQFTYVLKTTPAVPPSYYSLPETSLVGHTIPQYDNEGIITTNATCGISPWHSMNTTKIADVVAGSEVGFRVLNDTEVGFSGQFAAFYHPGPASVWLSKAPNNNVKAYRGEGDWFKIAYAGPLNDTTWSNYQQRLNPYDYSTWQDTLNFTIPKRTPPGEYLMRFEYLYPNSHIGYSQWNINCALVNIMGPGGSEPPASALAKFPGTYNREDASKLT
ncbi:unnamed protein product [Periconia digitata]|uniref:lytic cellulose monooxygenase (C4-dehydrogenating) n=1 Tax=Periconia digitata TaxID=1303443 RepID=A0A9W4U1N0_9PLEO|nr:unnamed protein product [Periconia digitata]